MCKAVVVRIAEVVNILCMQIVEITLKVKDVRAMCRVMFLSIVVIVKVVGTIYKVFTSIIGMVLVDSTRSTRSQGSWRVRVLTKDLAPAILLTAYFQRLLPTDSCKTFREFVIRVSRGITTDVLNFYLFQAGVS